VVRQVKMLYLFQGNQIFSYESECLNFQEVSIVSGTSQDHFTTCNTFDMGHAWITYSEK
jgi:hypothetical protein